MVERKHGRDPGQLIALALPLIDAILVATLALVLVGAVVWLSLHGAPVPTELNTAATGVLSFYVGRQSRARGAAAR